MDDLSEKEQLDALRAWWAENGSYVIGGIAVGIIVIFGWNWRQSTVANTEIAASMLFEDVMEAAALNLIDNAIDPAELLFAEYPSSPYASQARLAMARLYMDRGRDQDAADTLQPFVDAGATDEISLVGRLRLARIYLYQEKAEEAIGIAEGFSDTAFAARFNEVLGDAYVALERYTDAEAAYIAALNDLPQAQTVDVTLIQLKMNDLPGADQIAAAADAATAEADDSVAADDAMDTEISDEGSPEPADDESPDGEAGEPPANEGESEAA